MNELTLKEIEMIYTACKCYGDKLAAAQKDLSYEKEIADSLADRAVEFWDIAKKFEAMKIKTTE